MPEKWDPEEQPLRLHKLCINSREDSSIFVADLFCQQEIQQPSDNVYTGQLQIFHLCKK